MLTELLALDEKGNDTATIEKCYPTRKVPVRCYRHNSEIIVRKNYKNIRKTVVWHSCFRLSALSLSFCRNEVSHLIFLESAIRGIS
jgi:hypothetical protein